MIEQQYRVVADRDKGDEPQISDAIDGDLLAFRKGREFERDYLVRIERPVPTTDEPNGTEILASDEEMVEYGEAEHLRTPSGEDVSNAFRAEGWDRAYDDMEHVKFPNRNPFRAHQPSPSVPTREHSHTPTVAEFRAEYTALVSRLGHLDDTPGQTTRAWLNEFDRMVAAHLSVPTREQIAEAIYRAKYPASGLTLADETIMERSRIFTEADAVLALIQKGTDR